MSRIESPFASTGSAKSADGNFFMYPPDAPGSLNAIVVQRPVARYRDSGTLASGGILAALSSPPSTGRKTMSTFSGSQQVVNWVGSWKKQAMNWSNLSYELLKLRFPSTIVGAENLHRPTC